AAPHQGDTLLELSQRPLERKIPLLKLRHDPLEPFEQFVDARCVLRRLRGTRLGHGGRSIGFSALARQSVRARLPTGEGRYSLPGMAGTEAQLDDLMGQF